MKSPMAALLLFLLSTPVNSLADGWLLTTPDFTITETEITRTNKWVVLELFATALQCNDHRSSLLRQIDKERREIRDAKDHDIAAETERELRLLWHTYTTPSAYRLVSPT